MTRRGEHRRPELVHLTRRPGGGPGALRSGCLPAFRLVASWGVALILASRPGPSLAQPGQPPPVEPRDPSLVTLQSFALSLDRSAVALPALPPGGEVRINGALTYQPEGAIIDAGTGQSQGSGQAQGLIDLSGSGLALTGADAARHVYSYGLGPTDRARCAQAGLTPPCLLLRLPQLAAARLRDVDEFREQLQGQLVVEVSAPQQAAPVPVFPVAQHRPFGGPPLASPPAGDGPSWLWIAALGASGSGLALSLGLLVFGLRRRRRSQQTPIHRVEAAQRRLARQLAQDSGKERLRAVVQELAQEAGRQADRQAHLAAAITQANPTQLQQRRDQLRHQALGLAQRGGEAAGQKEMDEAANIVEQQLRRCEQWEMQRWRAGARLERIATRLEALLTELNALTVNGQQQNDELLELLQEELDLARAGEWEAAQVVESSAAPGEPADEA